VTDNLGATASASVLISVRRPPQLANPRVAIPGTVTFNLEGEPNVNYTIQATYDSRTWTKRPHPAEPGFAGPVNLPVGSPTPCSSGARSCSDLRAGVPLKVGRAVPFTPQSSVRFKAAGRDCPPYLRSAVTTPLGVGAHVSRVLPTAFRRRSPASQGAFTFGGSVSWASVCSGRRKPHAGGVCSPFPPE